MNKYVVLDLFYTPDEGQEVFWGTFEECFDFVESQGGNRYGFKIVLETRDY